jgi:hypothetical protein
MPPSSFTTFPSASAPAVWVAGALPRISWLLPASLLFSLLLLSRWAQPAAARPALGPVAVPASYLPRPALALRPTSAL